MNRLAWGIAATAMAGIAIWLGPILLGQNLHEVIPGQIYRSAQLDADELASLVQKLGLRSVLAVRAARPNKAWYVAERDVSRRLGLNLRNLNFNPDRMPAPDRLRQLVRELDAAPRPLLLHCRAGVERSGLASAVAVLLDGQPVDVARKQFSLRYGFHRRLAQSDLPRVLDRYDDWLSAQRMDHTPDRFRGWVEDTYVAAFYDAKLEIVRFTQPARAGVPLDLSLRVTNQSPDPLQFRSSHDRGVHLGTLIERVGVPSFSHNGRSGHEDRKIEPGGSEVFHVVLAPVPAAGLYRLTIDLVDESVVWFSEMGSNVLVTEFEVGAGS